ncbi:hypothetical protein [Bifidobacterium avesanii]|uniref:AbiEi antitoxin C-terminal domain-containing protein n=1 Tax=Bifidobacterium avesanii TaxID=1798157 RepID=A0A7K3TIY8_9BIFI|nr:hypothetical protein [Bifidobacterium avesanii]KAB8291940.1 hypothetical protein DSM100685_1124 [Bifidobacterium avesanii]NEG79041.1 hypothetical protein [Bifidobacterium avesanii]
MKTTATAPVIPSGANDSIIPASELPGPLGAAALARMGILVPLDGTGGYLASQARTVHGRAGIIQAMLPSASTACATLALWVWIGGEFPPNLQIVSHSHFRAAVYGRRIQVYDRKLDDRDRSRLGRLWVTSPARTACDLACAKPGRFDGLNVPNAIVELIREFGVTVDECLQLLWDNPRWPGHARGIGLLTRIGDTQPDLRSPEFRDPMFRDPEFPKPAGKTLGKDPS